MKYDPNSWSELLNEIAKYLCSIYEEFGAWLSATDTPDDDVFDDW